MDLIHEAIYEGRPLGRRTASAAMDLLRSAQDVASSSLNMLQSMVDTVVARNGKRRAMPVIGCDDAEYSEKRYAQRASRTLRRKMGTPHIEIELPLMMRDAVIRGDGYVMPVRSGGDVGLERFPRNELVYDDGEVRGGWPRTLARVMLVDREVLAARFPLAAKRIAKAPRAQREPWSPYDYENPVDNDMIEVAIGWRLPTMIGRCDGRCLYVLRDGGEPLRDKPWERMRFPLARVQWTPPMRGMAGIGLVQQLAGSQGKVNELWADHQEALYWGSALKIMVPRGSGTNKHQLRARHPAIVEVDGAMDRNSWIAPDPASRQAMDSLRWLIQQMYELAGISQAAAASKNPLGPNASGKALDTFYDIESDRFSYFENQYAQARVQCGQILLDEACDLAEEFAAGEMEYDVDKRGERDDDEDIELAPWIANIDWKRFDFDSGSYHLFVEPANFIPETRGGRLDVLGDLAKIPGFLSDPLQVASLFEEPDLARANRHLLGPMRMLERLMEMLADEDTPLEDCVPTPYMLTVPGLAKKMAEGELGNAFSEGASDEQIGRYRWFLTMLDGLEQEMAPPPTAGPSTGGAAPGVGPDAMPPMPPSDPGVAAGAPQGGFATPSPVMPLIGPRGGVSNTTIPDPLGGAAAMMAAGLPITSGLQ